MSTRILLIDDHQIIRDGLRLLLHRHPEYELVGNAYDTESGWQAVQELKPDLVLMDLDVPGEGGAALTGRITTKFPNMKVLVLTGHTEAQHVQKALEAGAKGYVLKANGFTVLVEALKTVVSGGTYLSPEVSTILVHQIQRRRGNGAPGMGSLSAREVEVLGQIADGHSTKEIASNMGISVKTVETHRMNLMGKLKLNTIADLTKYALREGLRKL